MIHSLVGPLPRHLYVYVDTQFTHRDIQTSRFIPAVWFGLTSTPGRVFGCTVMLESGAVYRNLPAHAIAFNNEPKGEWTERDAQTWDCYGWDWSATEYSFLRGLECKVMAGGKEHLGEYLFTVSPVGDGFSAYPEQAKEFNFVRLKSGHLTIQPTNHTVFRERSFTDNKLEFPSPLKRQTEIYTAE